MAGPLPKPDSQRRNKTAPSFEWTDLPPESGLKAPKLPDHREWHSQTRKWWRDVWKKPQALMWDASGESLWALVELYDRLFTGDSDITKVSAEIRQHEDRHGLNPKAMMHMRWRIIDDDESPAPRNTRQSPVKDRRGRVLELVKDA